MVLRKFIGFKIFIARACAPAYEKLQKRIVIAIVFAVSLFTLSFAADEDRQFLRGADSLIHSVRLNSNQIDATRKMLKVSGACSRIKTIASASALMGSENATLDPSITSKRGILVLEGLREHADSKTIYTVLLSPYKNYPTSIAGEIAMMPGSRYAFAVTLAAQVAGTGDLVLKKGDRITVHADGQLYTFALPAVTIPSGGLLRLYLGADDTLYFDAGLKHPFHAGPCGGKKS